MMDFHVTNENICVNEIKMTSVALGSVLKIGDTQSIQMFSTFDTPPESLIIGPFAQVATGTAAHGGAGAGAGGLHRGGV
ncbi:MAG: spore gernimation protein GerPD [Bacillales bacterium]|nr:spore gernimation protein GerPD [Bacillales bacterium]